MLVVFVGLIVVAHVAAAAEVKSKLSGNDAALLGTREIEEQLQVNFLRYRQNLRF